MADEKKRPFGIKELTVPDIPKNAPGLQMQRWVQDRINGGMVTMIEPANLPTNVMQLVQNARVRYDRTTRRAGTKLLTPAAPDGYSVLALAYDKDQQGNEYTVRLTPSTAHLLTSGVWAPFTFDAPLSGGNKDRMDFIDVLNKFIFSNNGADVLQTIDFAALNIGALGNAPKYRYITGFNNRAVGFALREDNEVQVGWSADGDATEWDPTVNETAGNAPLLESPADLSDYLKGGFAFTNVMVVLREKSIWLATKQPIPSNPFYFYSAIPGIGCDCPFSAQIIGNGIAWVDRRTKTVYAYSPGGAIEPIGRPIEKTLLDGIDDPETVFSAYDAIFNEYTVYVPTVGTDTVKAWTYNFNAKAWTYNEYYQIVSAHDAELSIAGARIRDLSGNISTLVGNIEDLSPFSTIVPVRAYGRSDGTLMIEDETVNTDAPDVDFPSGVPFDTVLTSKTFKIPSNDTYIAQINIEYTATAVGTKFILAYSHDDGATWVTAKTITPAVFNKSVLFIFRKVIRARRFTWRLTTDTKQINFESYEVWIYPSGPSRR